MYNLDVLPYVRNFLKAPGVAMNTSIGSLFMYVTLACKVSDF